MWWTPGTMRFTVGILLFTALIRSPPSAIISKPLYYSPENLRTTVYDRILPDLQGVLPIILCLTHYIKRQKPGKYYIKKLRERRICNLLLMPIKVPFPC